MPRAARGRRAVQLDLRQAEFRARQLAVVAGRLLRRRRVGGAGLLDAAGGFRGAALPIAGARQRGRVDAADADARKMLRGGRRVVQKAQRDPARGEFLLGLVDVARGQRRVARDQIGGAVLADVEHLARQQSPFDPPFVEIVQPARILRRAQHQLRGLGEFLLAAQQLDLAEDVAGIAVQFARHRVEQRPGVGGLAIGRDARFRQRHLGGAEPLRRAHARLPARCRRAADPSAPCGRPASAARRTGRAPCSRYPRTSNRCARRRAPGAPHWRGRRARSWPWPARTCLWPTAAIRFRTRPTRWRRRDGRPTAPLRRAGAGRSAKASSDWPTMKAR